LNADGSVPLPLITNSIDDDRAREAALKMFAKELKPFEIWRGQNFGMKGPETSKEP
jgi:hypothetical protein